MAERGGWGSALALFAAGFLCAWIAQAVLPKFETLSQLAVLLPFLVAVGVFAIASVLYLRDARRTLAKGSNAAVDGLQGSLQQVKSDFQQDIDHVLDDMRGALSTIVRQGEIVYELDFDDEGGDTESRCYKRLIELIDTAQESILSIPNPYRQGTRDVHEGPFRAEFLRAIERKLIDKKQAKEDFEYVRIQQVPLHTKPEDLTAHMGEIESAHVDRLRDMGYDNVHVTWIGNDEITGQLIIDEKIFVNLISAVDRKGRKRMVAIGVMTDPVADSVKKYYRKLKPKLTNSSRVIKHL